jgi:hypothetical protein
LARGHALGILDLGLALDFLLFLGLLELGVHDEVLIGYQIVIVTTELAHHAQVLLQLSSLESQPLG